jgi:hypothetical protein
MRVKRFSGLAKMNVEFQNVAKRFAPVRADWPQTQGTVLMSRARANSVPLVVLLVWSRSRPSSGWISAES